MNFYIDIILLTDSEISLSFIWQKVYQQVHLALVEMKDSNGEMNIGVSFPQYKTENSEHPLGNIIRIFGAEKSTLDQLNILKWLSKLNDYVSLSEITTVPESIKSYASFKRVREKGNNERLARRKAKRDGIDFEEALLKYKDRKEKIRKEPFVQIKSLSTGHSFNLKIDFIEKTQMNLGCFDSYGLSSESTVPIF